MPTRIVGSVPVNPLVHQLSAAIAAGPLSLEIALPAYLDFKLGMRGIAASSALTYERSLRRFIGAVGAAQTLDEASGLVEPFLLALARRGSAESYRAKAFRNIRDFYRWGCEHGHAQLNPLRDFKAPIVRDVEMRFCTELEIDRLLEAVRTSSTIHARRDHAIYATLYGTWGRVSEVCRTRPEDYDLPNCTVRFYGKGGKIRVIPFDPKLRPVLVDWLALRPRESPMMFAARGYTSGEYTVLERDRVARALREIYAPAAGLGDGVTPHTLRRSGADHARQRKVPLWVIQRILGHKLITTTMRYLKVPSSDELKGAWESEHD